MKLATPLKFNEYVQPIALPKSNNEPTGNVWLSGWGSTSTTNYPIMPSNLQHVMMHLIDRKSCDAMFTDVTGSPSPVDETNICTGPLSRKPNSACSVCAKYSANSINDSSIVKQYCSNFMYRF